jgi:hypothetical protein
VPNDNSSPPAAPDEPSVRRATALELNERRVNEAIERDVVAGGARSAFVCECGRVGCNSLIELPRAAYDAVRSHFDRFFVVPGHEIVGVDEVLERHGDYSVVVKTGIGAAIVRDAHRGREGTR